VFVDYNCGRLLGISVGGGQEIDEGLVYPNRTEAYYIFHTYTQCWLVKFYNVNLGGM
jgi:hypothetical protein